MINQSELLTVAIQAALHAGHILKAGFGTAYEISSKEGRHNLVTTYDKRAESIISKILMERFPTHGFLGEESGHQKSGDVLWIVDPLDGTVNFARNIPLFSVSIAAAVEGQVIAGVVYQPMTEELFWAEKGKGSYLNGTKISVSKQEKLYDAFLATGFPYHVQDNPLSCIETFSRLTGLGIPIRRLGSAAVDLSYVAAGRFDGYWEVSLESWDLAAGLLLVQEAGGRVSRYDGSLCDPLKTGPVLATNGHLHAELQKAVNS